MATDKKMPPRGLTGAAGDGRIAGGDSRNHGDYTTFPATPQSPQRATLSALLETADAEERLHAELAALHAQRAELVRARRARLEHYAFAEAGR